MELVLMSSVETEALVDVRWIAATEFPWESIPHSFAECLQDTKSLTQRWRALSQNNLHHELASEGWQDCTPDELQPLASTISTGNGCWTREIIFYGNGVPWEWAKTIIPDSSLVDEGLAFINLGNKPIGDILFTDPDLKRSEFEIAQLGADHPYALLIKDRLQLEFDALWARRSLLYFHQKPLLIYEVFLPAVFEALSA